MLCPSIRAKFRCACLKTCYNILNKRSIKNHEKTIVLLIACLILSGAICGCQSTTVPSPSATASDAQSTTASPASTEEPITTEEYEADAGVLEKMYSLCYPTEEIKKEFTALVYSVSENSDGYTLTIDKVEETKHEDPQEEFYTNAEAKKEEYVVDVNAAQNMVVLVDPHNHFKALTFAGLQKYIDSFDDALPMYFYSYGGDVVMISEMMLP